MVNFVPGDLNEALSMMADYHLIPYGGGTDLMVKHSADAAYLFLHKVKDMQEIKNDGEYVRIGAGCTFTEIQNHRMTPPLIKSAVSQIAAPAIRNLGTIGGNVGNGSAKADSVLALYALGAYVRLASASGERLVPIREFYQGRRKLDLKEDELIVEMLIPNKNIGPYYYEKTGARKALAISRVSFAGVIVMQQDKIVYCAAAFGAVNDVIFTVPELDAMFLGKTAQEAGERRKTYLQEYDRVLIPQKGRISAEYRKTVCMNMLEEFLDIMSPALTGRKETNKK